MKKKLFGGKAPAAKPERAFTILDKKGADVLCGALALAALLCYVGTLRLSGGAPRKREIGFVSLMRACVRWRGRQCNARAPSSA